MVITALMLSFLYIIHSDVTVRIRYSSWTNQTSPQLQNLQSCHPYNAHTPLWMLAWNCEMIASQMVLLLFNPEDATSGISTLHLSPSEMSSGPEKVATCLDDVYIWFLLCLVEFQPALLDAVMICVHRHWFWEVFLSRCRDFHSTIISDLNTVPSEAQEITALSLNTVISLDSLNLFIEIIYHIMMKCPSSLQCCGEEHYS